MLHHHKRHPDLNSSLLIQLCCHPRLQLLSSAKRAFLGHQATPDKFSLARSFSSKSLAQSSVRERERGGVITAGEESKAQCLPAGSPTRPASLNLSSFSQDQPGDSTFLFLSLSFTSIFLLYLYRSHSHSLSSSVPVPGALVLLQQIEPFTLKKK